MIGLPEGKPAARWRTERRCSMSTHEYAPDEKNAARESGSAGVTPLRESALGEMRFFTVAEVAEVMRVSRMTVYRLVHSGELPAVRVGRSFRVPQRAVNEYLQAAFTDAG